METKENNKKSLFETTQIEDAEKAKKTIDLAKINQIRILIGLGIAAVATVLTAIGLFAKLDNSEVFFGISFLLAIPAYIIGGGILRVIKAAWAITKFGWFLIPTFPADILIAAVCFIFSIFAFLFVPVIFVGLNFLDHKKRYDAAHAYLEGSDNVVDYTEE